MSIHVSRPARFSGLAAAGVASALFATPLIVHAQDSAPQPLWELGAGALAVSQQAYPGAAQRVGRGLVFPYLIYRGKIFRSDRDGLGLVAIRTPEIEVDVGFAGAFGSNSNDIDARRGMPDLGTLVEFGPRLKWNLGAGPANGRLRADFALRGVFDLSDGFSNKGISFEPKLIYERASGQWRYSTSAGLIMANQKLADTFYGVAPAYANAFRPAYNAESGLVAWRLGANVSRQLSSHVRLFGYAQLDSLASAANNASPLVQKRFGSTLGVGLIYTFARSETLVSN
jgi:MipA family protein